MRRALKLPVVLWLRCWARVWLARKRPLFIAVGGSSGKTSVVGGIAAALRPVRRVRVVSQNADTGVPLGILGLRIDRYGLVGWVRVMLAAPIHALGDGGTYDVVIAEYGIDHPGDMASLLKVRVPDIAVITSVGLEHAGYFPQERFEEVLDAIADEEMALIAALTDKGVAVVPANDARIAARLDTRARVVTVGSGEGADCEVLRYRVTEHGTDADLFYRGVTYPVQLKRPVTRAAVRSVALAAAAAEAAGASFREALAAIAATGDVPPGRGRVLQGRDGMLLIDSSYNATPEAVVDALGLLNDLGGARRRVAVLGDMRELGDHAPAAHESIAEAVSESADLVLLVGPMTARHLVPRIRGGVNRVESFASVSELLERLDLLESQDVVLIKGSQNTLFLERVTERLLNREADRSQLPRRGERWDAIRAAAA